MPLIDRFALLFGRRLLRGDFVSDHEINGVVAFINADSQAIQRDSIFGNVVIIFICIVRYRE